MPNLRGGHISSNENRKNYAQVEEAVVTSTGSNTANWVITLKDVPRIANFRYGENLTYNTKGTKNPNANNALSVTEVLGPTRYLCNGNWPINT